MVSYVGQTTLNEGIFIEPVSLLCEKAALPGAWSSLMANSQCAPSLYGVKSEFMIRAVDLTEALANLNYLIRLDSGDPGRVRSYVGLAEESLHALEDLFRSAAWEEDRLRAESARKRAA
jgi:hypothetical protein